MANRNLLADLTKALAAPGPSRKVSRLSDLTAERASELLDYDPETGLLRWKVDRGRFGRHKAGSIVQTRNSYGYIVLHVDGKMYGAHRLAWLLHYGEWPSSEVDHINCDASDNRLCNLRQATRLQNLANRRGYKSNVNGLKGVSFEGTHGKNCGTPWRSRITHNGKTRTIGRFRCPTAAHIAYCKAAKEHFGEYARTA